MLCIKSIKKLLNDFYKILKNKWLVSKEKLQNLKEIILRKIYNESENTKYFHFLKNKV